MEVLDDGLEEQETKEDLPFFFGNKIASEENKIEEVSAPIEEESIVDPVASIIKLDPAYEQKIEELDLDENYQMNIKIKK